MNDFNGENAPSVPEVPVVAETQAPEVPQASMEDTMSKVWDEMNSPDKPRDPGGKFTAAETTESAKPAAPEKVIDQPLDKVPEPVFKPAIEAPNSWSAEMKAKFGALPPDAQEYIAQREREAHAAITQKGEQIRAFEPIRQTLDQHREVFARNGVSEAEGVQKLIEADRFLETNPVEGIKWLAGHYGVDLRQFTGNPANTDQSQAPSREVFELRQEVTRLKNYLTAQERTQHETQQATVATEIEEFASKNPYFSEVEPELLGLIPIIRSQEPNLNRKEVLEKAYERATYANPNVRQRIIADQQKADQEKQRKEQEEAAKKAKSAASLVQRSAPGTSPTKGASMEETMGAVYDRLMSNG